MAAILPKQLLRRLHIPVLPKETLGYWAPCTTLSSQSNHNINARQFFVDGTVGLGGHSRLLLQSHPKATLLCIDRDPEVVQ